MDSTRLHLRSVQQIISALALDQPELLGAIDQIILRLDFGLPGAGLGLLDLPLRLTRGQYLALLLARITQISDIDAWDRGALSEVVGEEAAARIARLKDATK